MLVEEKEMNRWIEIGEKNELKKRDQNNWSAWTWAPWKRRVDLSQKL